MHSNISSKAPVHTALAEVDAYDSTQYRGGPPSWSLDTTYRNGDRLRTVAISESGHRAAIAGAKTLKILLLHEDEPGCGKARDVRQDIFNQKWSLRSSQAPKSSPGRHTEVYDLDTAKRDLFDIEDVAWSAGAFSSHIATAVRNGKIVLYDIVRAGIHVNSYHDHMRQVHTLSFNPHDGRYLLSGSQDGLVKLFDLRDSRPAISFPGRSDAVRDVQWSPTDGFIFAFGTDNGTVQHWTIQNNRDAIKKRSAHEQTCSSVDWHPDGKQLASAGHDSTVKIWDTQVQTRHPALTFSTPQPIQNVRWRPACFERAKQSLFRQCTQLATSYRDHPFIDVWDLRRPDVPFRKIFYSKNLGTTDIVWRSRDLLWAVGPQGDFQQFDIPFTTETTSQWPPTIFSSGINALHLTMTKPPKAPKDSEGRKKPTPVKIKSSAELKQEEEDRKKQEEERIQAEIDWEEKKKTWPADWTDNSGGGREMLPMRLVTRSLGDDGFNDGFLSAGLRKQKRSVSAGGRARPVFIETPPEREVDLKRFPIQDLQKTLKSYKPHQARQVSFTIAPYPPGDVSRAEVDYMHENYHQPPLVRPDEADFGNYIAEACDHNAEIAKQANQYSDSKTWQMNAHLIRQNPEASVKRLLATIGDAPVREAEEEADNATIKEEEEEADDLTIKQEEDEDEDGEPKALAPIDELFRDLLKYYCESHEANIQMAAEILKLLLPALPSISAAAQAFNEDIDEETIEKYRSDLHFAGIPYGQAAAILLSHEQDLRRRGFPVNAAYVRKLAQPTFPGIFAMYQEDKSVGVPPKTTEKPCCFCSEKKSFYDGGTLWSWCAQCGHSIHIGCSNECWDDPDDPDGTGGKCPMDDCDCGCVPGWWRDTMEKVDEKAEAKADKVAAAKRGAGPVLGERKLVGESKAVERVRGVLREEGNIAGLGPPKRVKFDD